MIIYNNSSILVIFFYLIILKTLLGQPMERNLENLMPSKIEGWIIAEKDQVYGPNNLYEYIDGGAELFLSYGFQQMMSRIYISTDQPDIIVDVFDMETSYNAYGVFSYSREKEDTTFGQGSQYVPGLLLFWKNRFYISILFNPETDKARQAAFYIARHIESSINSEGPLPDILKLLPETSLLKETIRYFRHHIWLNSYHFISNENILHINDNTDAVLAKYGKKEDTQLLLIVIYPGELEAETARDNFISSYLPILSQTPIAQRNEKWVGCQLNDNILIVVFNSKHKESVQNILKSIK